MGCRMRELGILSRRGRTWQTAHTVVAVAPDSPAAQDAQGLCSSHPGQLLLKAPDAGILARRRRVQEADRSS